MAIEAISGAGMTYQGSVSTAEIRHEAQSKVDASEIQITSEKIASETTAIDTKETSAEGGQDNPARELSTKQRQEAIKKAVEDINKRANSSEAIFGIHEGTNRVTIKLVDKETKKLIKELPPEETLDMIAKVWEMAGILVDEKR